MALHHPDTDPQTAAATDSSRISPEPQRPPSPGGISMRPAMVVLGLAVLILVVFVTIGIVSSQAPTPLRTGRAASTVVGTTLRAEAAGRRLSPIVAAGEPPTNIRNAVFLPVGSTSVSHQDNSAGAGQFDAQVTFRSGASQAALLSFFASDMKLEGWQIFDRGSAANDANAVEVLGKLAGSDGYYWEMGATVQATTFKSSGPAHGVTDFTIRLFQLPDED